MSPMGNQPQIPQLNDAGQRIGLAYWMKEVVRQCGLVTQDFAADPVHDLRTALRRCRSIADGLMALDPYPDWKKMKRAGKQLFSSLGALRDIHVMDDWVKHFSQKDDITGKILFDYVLEQEHIHAATASVALQEFNRKQWLYWAEELPARAAHIPLDSPMFAHLALEKWTDARVLHRNAIRRRTSTAYHQLRIGLKRFRYIVENFLPTLHQHWGKDLKKIQDTLGELHDFDVLWSTAVNIEAFPDPETRARWHERLEAERQQRIDTYREKMIGPQSLWRDWRAGLPHPDELRNIALERMQTWASFLDPDHAHARHVSSLALELYDALSGTHVMRRTHSPETRQVLELSALMHDVGRSKVKRGHHKASAKMIAKLPPPLGWTAQELGLVALVARYHRGALPQESHREYSLLSESRKKRLLLLAGILRLACACDRQHDSRIRHLSVEPLDRLFKIRAEGLSELDPLAQHLASARYLLEVACECPIFVLPAQAETQLAAGKAALGAA